MIKQPLESASWTLRPVGDLSFLPKDFPTTPIPATVPGCVHTALLAHNLIPDPYHGTNELSLKWIGQTDWEYRCSFHTDEKLFEHERIDLACDGLDTVATIALNGVVVGQSENMHVGYRFDLKPTLRQGSNDLVITFASPTRYAYAMRDKLGQLPRMNCPVPFNFIRKMACNFGWDWGPEVITSGIWRGISIEGWSQIRIKEVRHRFLPEERRIAVRVDLDYSSTASHLDGDWQLVASLSEEVGTRNFRHVEHWSDERPNIEFEIEITSLPILWWPTGHGAPFLYVLEIEEVRNTEGWHKDRWRRRIGLRTVELDTSPDAVGNKFVLKVNGQPIFCRGFNWIPDDCFLDRATDPARVRQRIEQAKDANANMLRVWGGGIYETDAFYDICDELGILVWQDFLFACAMYPEEEPIRNLVEQEVRYNVSRLSHHPSLVLWNGCNENLWGYRDWSDGEVPGKTWQSYDNVDGRTWGKGYYLDLIPSILKELDPTRPYWAASPWSGDTDIDKGLHPNVDTHGNMHIWDVWNQKPATVYRKYKPRFTSEFGWQAPPTYATMVKGAMIDPAKSVFDTPEWKLHQKHPHGEKQNRDRASDWFDLPGNFDDDVYLLQVAQARGLQLGVEWYRSLMPHCMGTLYWQLNDCWPVNSWAAIDSDGRPKPLWYATRRFFAPRLLTIQPEGENYTLGDHLWLHAINGTSERWSGVNRVRHVDFVYGDVQGRNNFNSDFDCVPHSTQKSKLFGEPIGSPLDPTRTVLVADFGTHRTLWFFDVDKNLNCPPASFDSHLVREGDVTRLTIAAKTLLRDIAIFVDRLDPQATISDQLVTLLPGESVTFEIRSKQELTVEMLTSHPVFQCANRFGKPTD